MDPVVSDCEHGDIRLVGGSTALEGRVEVCMNRVWGTVCDNFNTQAAGVVCAQLGYQRAGIIRVKINSLLTQLLCVHVDSTYSTSSFYGASSAFSYMTSLRCSGSENRLIDCSYNPIAHTGCGQGQQVGVQCVGTFVIALIISFI